MLHLDATVSEHLTRYLKHFKTLIHSYVSFIECCLGESSEDQQSKKMRQLNNPEYQIDEMVQKLSISKQSLKIVERFCMRINEYTQYRLNKAKIQDEFVAKQLKELKKTLYGIFFNVSKTLGNLKLTDIICKVSQINNKHFIRIFQKIITPNYQVPIRMQQEIKNVIINQLNKQNSRLRQQKNQQINQSIHRLTRISKISNYAHVQGIFIKPVLRPRRVTLENNVGKNYLSCFQVDSVPQVSTASKIISRFNNQSVQYHSPTIQYKEDRYPNLKIHKNMEGAMEFELNFQPAKSTDEMLKELKDLNKKNSNMINKFAKKCARKKKKVAFISSTSDAKLLFNQKIISHRRSNTIQEEPKPIKNIKKQSILPIIRKKKSKF